MHAGLNFEKNKKTGRNLKFLYQKKIIINRYIKTEVLHRNFYGPMATAFAFQTSASQPKYLVITAVVKRIL